MTNPDKPDLQQSPRPFPAPTRRPEDPEKQPRSPSPHFYPDAAEARSRGSPSGFNTQPAPGGNLLDASLTIAATSAGSVGPSYVGLPLRKKSSINENPHLSTPNANPIGLFKPARPQRAPHRRQLRRQERMECDRRRTNLRVNRPQRCRCPGRIRQRRWQAMPLRHQFGRLVLRPVATTPTLAAQEVAYEYQRSGSSLLGVEIGNRMRPLRKHRQLLCGNWSLAQFLTLWGHYRSAILATTPNAPISWPSRLPSPVNLDGPL